VFGDTIEGTTVPSRKRWYTRSSTVHTVTDRSVSFPHTFQVIQRCQVGCSAEIISMQNYYSRTDALQNRQQSGIWTENGTRNIKTENLLLPECVELYLHKWPLHSKRPGYTFSSTTVIMNKIQTSQQTYSINITKISRIMLFVVIITHNTVWSQRMFVLKQVCAHSNHWRWLLCAPPGLTPKILRSAHTVYLCALCGSENKQRLFPYTALTDWFL